MAQNAKIRRESWTHKMADNTDFIDAYRQTGYMVNK
jgi:hypothetical protein